MQKLLIIIISLHFYNVINAQDIIIQTNGDEIKAKVQEIDDVMIKYHKYENLTGPVYSINKLEVFMIKYENGTKDVFEKKEVKQEISKQEKPKSNENISIERGRYYYQGKRIRNPAIKEILKTNASPEILQDFNKGCNNELTGNIIGYSGDLVFLIGSVIYLSSYDDISYTYTNKSALGIAAAGIGVLMIGEVFLISGSIQKKKSLIKYNNSLSSSFKPELYFGASQNGVGLIMKF